MTYSYVLALNGSFYRLQSVVCFLPEKRHYVTYVRPTTGDQWYLLDDTNVTKVSPKEALAAKDKAYLLFYVRDEMHRPDIYREPVVPRKYAEVSNIIKQMKLAVIGM